ncbi:hypothetical protein DW848_09215 [Agathobacter rectalis]|uniref:Uncharacterized protein n=1 Tax=Agathobacter rectalis TaxID=39491 RepID=A0A414A0N4_9FIRM|nr:hypothetical protein DW848_09215 [Agathobacter rectalis]
MPRKTRNAPAWKPGQGAIEPWRASSDGFVWHRKTIRHNSYSILAAKRSEHESVHAACAAGLYLLTPAAYHGCNITPHLVILKYSK